MLPSPIAEPAIATITESRLLKFSLGAISITVFSFYKARSARADRIVPETGFRRKLPDSVVDRELEAEPAFPVGHGLRTGNFPPDFRVDLRKEGVGVFHHCVDVGQIEPVGIIHHPRVHLSAAYHETPAFLLRLAAASACRQSLLRFMQRLLGRMHADHPFREIPAAAAVSTLISLTAAAAAFFITCYRDLPSGPVLVCVLFAFFLFSLPLRFLVTFLRGHSLSFGRPGSRLRQ